MPRSRAWAAVGLLTALLVSCGGAAQNETPAPSPAPVRRVVAAGTDVTVALVVKARDDEYWRAVGAGAAAAAAANPHVTVEVVGPDAETLPRDQAAALDAAVAHKVDAIVVAPGQWSIVGPALERAVAAGIPVVLIDAAPEAFAAQVSFVGTDNQLGGQLAGELIVKRLGRGSVVAIVRGVAGDAAHDAREAGARAAFGAAGLRLSAVRSAAGDRGKAAEITAQLLATQPELAGVFATDDAMALGVLDAARADGRSLVVVGFGGSVAAREAVTAGELAATVAMAPEQIGQLGVETAVRVAYGLDVARIRYTGIELLTADPDVDP